MLRSEAKGVKCMSSEPCDDDDDCERGTCEDFDGEDLCSNEFAAKVINAFIGYMVITNSLALFCCIRVCWQKR